MGTLTKLKEKFKKAHKSVQSGESDLMYSVTVGGHINWVKDGGTATEKGIRRGQVRRV